MISNGKKIVYGISLNDYFTASFCSSTKTYYGTLDEIKTFVDALDNEQFSDTKEAFKRYLAGDTKVTHYIAYNQHRIIEKAEVLAEEEIELDKTSWKFLNLWSWPQYMEIDSGTVKMMLLKHGKTYFRAIKATVSGLRSSVKEDRPADMWLELCGGFWGHPCMLIVTDKGESYVVHSSLYMKEKEYATEQEAIENFRTDTVCLDCLCEDVFGDG